MSSRSQYLWDALPPIARQTIDQPKCMTCNGEVDESKQPGGDNFEFGQCLDVLAVRMPYYRGLPSRWWEHAECHLRRVRKIRRDYEEPRDDVAFHRPRQTTKQGPGELTW